MNTAPENNDDAWVSKTQKKKQMDALQDLGAELTRLSEAAGLNADWARRLRERAAWLLDSPGR